MFVLDKFHFVDRQGSKQCREKKKGSMYSQFGNRQANKKMFCSLSLSAKMRM